METDALREILEAASPLPWRAGPDGNGNYEIRSKCPTYENQWDIVALVEPEDNHSTAQANAQLAALGAKHLVALRDALQAARDHLEYCSYGDSWERQCAAAEKLPERLEQTLDALDADAKAMLERKEIDAR